MNGGLLRVLSTAKSGSAEEVWQYQDESNRNISCIEWGQDGTRLVLGTEAGAVSVIEAMCEEPSWTSASAHTGRVSGVCWTGAGQYVVSCGVDCCVRLWDGSVGLCVHACVPSSTELQTMCSTGDLVLAAGAGSSISVWEFALEGAAKKATLRDLGGVNRSTAADSTGGKGDVRVMRASQSGQWVGFVTSGKRVGIFQVCLSLYRVVT